MTKEKVLAGTVITLRIAKRVLAPVVVVVAFIFVVMFGTLAKVFVSSISGR
jgi:hypothetical protein